MLALLALIAALVCFIFAVVDLGGTEWVAVGLVFLTIAAILGNPVISRRIQ